MPVLVLLLVIVIPILVVFTFAGYKEWLKYRAEQEELGPTSQKVHDQLAALQERVEALEEEREALQERVQNLETIVTSESWIARHEEEASLDAAPVDELRLPDRESSKSEAEHSAELARRLRGE